MPAGPGAGRRPPGADQPAPAAAGSGHGFDSASRTIPMPQGVAADASPADRRAHRPGHRPIRGHRLARRLADGVRRRAVAARHPQPFRGHGAAPAPRPTAATSTPTPACPTSSIPTSRRAVARFQVAARADRRRHRPQPHAVGPERAGRGAVDAASHQSDPPARPDRQSRRPLRGLQHPGRPYRGNRGRRRGFAAHRRGRQAGPRLAGDFNSRIIEVNFNPFWTVPVSIVRRDLIPLMQDGAGLPDEELHPHLRRQGHRTAAGADRLVLATRR